MTEREYDDPFLSLGYTPRGGEEVSSSVDSQEDKEMSVERPHRTIGEAAAKRVVFRRSSRIDVDYGSERDIGIEDPYPAVEQVANTAMNNHEAVDEMLHRMKIERIRNSGESETIINARIRAAEEVAKKQVEERRLLRELRSKDVS
ncbi:hypothetical protein A2791_04300 [Candidatus Saccharibacteria bacterium RIFCSPHIGHO2_01_FULL_46_30]|nr:MAG: hypothetical protein A2791_04300 [Candidatus Saccharibacteria bacterium RIFCSPHIGHO2_01_FULL_46_30]